MFLVVADAQPNILRPCTAAPPEAIRVSPQSCRDRSKPCNIGVPKIARFNAAAGSAAGTSRASFGGGLVSCPGAASGRTGQIDFLLPPYRRKCLFGTGKRFPSNDRIVAQAGLSLRWLGTRRHPDDGFRGAAVRVVHEEQRVSCDLAIKNSCRRPQNGPSRRRRRPIGFSF